MKRKIFSILLASLLLLSSIYYVQAENSSDISPDYPEETVSCCGTDPELLQELNSALISKRNAQLQNEIGVSRKAIYSPSDMTDPKTLMQSTGTAKILVLTLNFDDYTLDRLSDYSDRLYSETYNDLEEIFFLPMIRIKVWVSNP